MGSNAAATGSQIAIVNGTRYAVWVAVYRRSALRPFEPPIAWRVESMPPRGKTTVFIPRGYQVCARYSFEPENPRRPVYQTNSLPVLHAPAGAGFVVEAVTLDRRTWGAVLTRAKESPGWHQVRIVNHFNIGVWILVRQQERNIFPPRILSPMAAGTEDLGSPLFLAVLRLPHAAGNILRDCEIVLTETTVQPGESVKVEGGPRKGFKISKTQEKACKTGRRPVRREPSAGRRRQAGPQLPVSNPI